MEVQTEVAIVAACVTGLLLHVIYNRYEPTIGTFFLNVFALTGLCSLLTNYWSGSLKKAASTTLIFFFLHLAVLSLSIAIYRLFLHPLRRYQGPWTAKLSKWADFSHTCVGRRHEWLPALHAKYGEIVRIGPNELSFSNPGAVKYLHGPQGARLNKGPYYDATMSMENSGSSVAGTRDWDHHKFGRRIWDHGFSQKALKSYEPRITGLLDEMCHNLAALNGTTVDMSLWTDCFFFDTMGDLAFNESFGLLSPDGPRAYSGLVRKGMQVFSTVAIVPWVSPVVSLLPILVPNEVKSQAKEFQALGKAQYQKRRTQGTEPNDLFSHLIRGDKEGRKMKEKDLEAEAPTIIIAGSDTSSICATFLLYFVTRDTSCYARLRDEIDAAWDGKGPLEGNTLGPETCPYLNGAIYEALRILPPGPNGMQRRTGPEGHVVDGTPIPPCTQVSSNTIALHRNPNNFTEPMKFIPERWIEGVRDPSWNHDVRAFIPFSSGTFGCAGRALAMLEIRLFCAKLLRRFDLVMAADFDHEAFMGAVKSYQSLIKGPLPLVIKARE